MMRYSGMVLLISAVLIMSCVVVMVPGWDWVRGSGTVVEKAVEVQHFSGVELATVGNLHVEIGETESLRIEAEDNLIDTFEISVQGDTLRIGSRWEAMVRATRPINFYLTAGDLDMVILSGSGNIWLPDLAEEQLTVKIGGSGDVKTGTLQAEEIEMRIAGSGDLEVSASEADDQQIIVAGSGSVDLVEIEADYVEVDIAGSGSVDVSGGNAGEQDVTITGSGDYRARRVECSTATVFVGGSGTAMVWVEERLDAKIAGSGDVRYVGDPSVSQTVHGSGDVRQVGE